MADDFFSRTARSFELIKASADVLRSDRELLVLPLISGLASLAVGGAFVWQMMGNDALMALAGQDDPDVPLWFYGWLFAFYFIQYFIIIFFNTALVGAAIARLSGGDPTVSSALGLAVARIVPIVGYALVSATLGVVLRAIAEKLGFIGRLIEGFAGLAWTVATFLVVPVLAAEGVGPFTAIGRSSALLSGTWGENLIGNGGIGLVTSFIAAAIAVIGGGGGVLALSSGNVALGIPILVVAAVFFIAVVLFSAALSAVYAAAVYYFALTGESPHGFDPGLIRAAFRPKDAT